MDDNRNEPLPVLLVDDEIQVLLLYSALLKGAGVEPLVTMDDSRRVLPFLRENRVLAVLSDMNMPFLNGRDLLSQIKQEFPEIPVLIVTGVDDIDTAVECMRLGASDYLVKPVEKSRLVSSLQRTLEIARLQDQVSSLTRHLLADGLRRPGAFAHLVTGSRKMLALFKYVEVVADSPYPALIAGETGVGKELVARALHLAGDPERPFVGVNVAGLDDNMFSDTLFGHKKGAFTGAESQRDGLISQAQDGTLFLDEIGDLNPTSQVKLLRLIQEKEYYPLGIDQPKRTNARIVCSTNHDLKKLVENGTFRKDLYFRLNTHVIVVPPLRDRKEDIPMLLGHFMAEAAQALHKRTPTSPPELLALLAAYEFPGQYPRAADPGRRCRLPSPRRRAFHGEFSQGDRRRRRECPGRPYGHRGHEPGSVSGDPADPQAGRGIPGPPGLDAGQWQPGHRRGAFGCYPPGLEQAPGARKKEKILNSG